MPLSPIPGDIQLQSGLRELLAHCQAYDLLASAVAVLDAQAGIVYQNAAFASFNASVRDSVEFLSLHAALLDCPDVRQWIGQALEAGQPLTLRREFHYAPRIRAAHTLQARPIVTADGGLSGLLLTIADESIEFDRRHIARAQEAYRDLLERIKVLDRQRLHNDNLIRLLLKEAPFALVLISGEREVIQSNRAAELLFKRSASELVGRKCDTLLDCFSRCAECPALARDGKIEAEELYGIGSQREVIPLMRNVVVLDREKDPLILEAFIDLSEHKKNRESIERLSEFNRLLVESTGEGILSVDRDLRCTFANRAAAGMLGYSVRELVGQDIHALFHCKSEDETPLPKEGLPIARAIESNTGLEASEVFWNRNGHAVPVQYTCNPLHDGQSVSGAVIVYRNVSEARATARKLDYLASHDLLTGLLNRHAFEKELAGLLSRTHDHEHGHMLCYIDLDQFKIVNDTCGHSAGDELLRQLSALIHGKLRKSDLLARLGGDEFGLILQDCPPDKALAITRSILTLIGEYRFSWDGKVFSLGASIGLVELGAGIADAGSAMSAADSACYMAKEHGRNRVHVFQSNDQDLHKHQLEIEWVNRIRTALNDGRLVLMAQAIAPVSDPQDKYRHMELLLRLLDDAGRMISPGTFITAAERYGFMSQVDKWVVTEALKILDRNRHYLERIDYICINLSGQSVTDDLFLAYLLDQFGMRPDIAAHICLEITETAAVANLSRATQFMHRLKEVGCVFALDDFGSGMSSFAYLKNLPVDFLKIDGNFVRDMAHDKVDYAMVEAIHRVGNVMNLKTIAEFVEDAAILARLRHIGVDYAQGYGIHVPEPLDQFLKHVEA
jgi:diguanylate cyclase (GGDEF)-like protein/PAS domain S-box-containing protein